EPEAALARALEQREAECAALRGDGNTSCGQGARSERRVHADRRDGDAEAVRSDEPGAVGADERDELVLPCAALAAHFGEAGRDDAERPNPGAQRLVGG